MKYIKRLVRPLFFVALCSPIFVSAQKSMQVNDQLSKAIELYHANQYVSSEKMIQELKTQISTSDPIYADAEYYDLMCDVRRGDRSAEANIQNYLKSNSETPFQNKLRFELGRLQFERKRYKSAFATLKQVKKRGLNKDEIDDLSFFMAYCNLEYGSRKTASTQFLHLKKNSVKYKTSASYYWGYINYLDKNYNTALKEFVELEKNPTYAKVIPYYIAQIYYFQGEYHQAADYSEKLLQSNGVKDKDDLYKIAGESYFELKSYDMAAKYLQMYPGIKGKKTRDDHYRLGYSQYRTAEYSQAITNLQKASAGDDALAQNSLYFLAAAYVALEDKDNARMSFQQASELDFNPEIKEDALFNFAKITYETSYSPFNETIKAFDKYISLYPNSERNDAAFDYLVRVYMTTKNYADAIESIKKIKNPTPAIQEAYQRVTFYRSLEFFNNGEYKKAIAQFDQSLRNSKFNREYKAQSTYWHADAYFKLGNFKEAIRGFKSFKTMPGAVSMNEFYLADYNIGYAYFAQEDYQNALIHFRNYINQSKTGKTFKSDALNRAGDCYYIDRDFSPAAKLYTQAIEIGEMDVDYALFQRGMCFGLTKGYLKKISDFKIITEEYPGSDFADDAYYEIGRTYERINKSIEAIEYYTTLIKKYPQSIFTPKSYLQLGLLYYNKSDYTKSINYYKNIVENYPNTDESTAALLGIKNNYIEKNSVDEYFAYVATLDQGNSSMSQGAQDSLFYISAEKGYLNGDPGSEYQFKEYLARFPQGMFRLNSQFYLGESLYKLGKFSESLEYFDVVSEEKFNIFTEQALMRAGELNYNAKRYELSRDQYVKLERIASTKWNVLKSRAGLMRTHYALEDYYETISASVQLLNTEKVTKNLVREANYKMADSYDKIGKKTESLKFFEALAVESTTKEGAEANYRCGQLLFDLGKRAESEQRVMDFIAQGTPHSYWMAKAFVLLAEIHYSNGDIFRAKHTLKSTIENYNNETDGIKTYANDLLTKYEEEEAKTVLPSDTIGSASEKTIEADPIESTIPDSIQSQE